MVQAQAAADATLTIGEGAGAYSLTDSDGVFSSLAEGWTVTAKKVSATPVTLSVARDSNAVADKMEQLVKAANDVLKEIKTQTFVSSAKGGNRGALAGDATIKSIAASIRSAFSGGVGRSNVPGLNFTRDGVIEFDKAVFKTKYESDPVAVSSALSKAGTSTGAGITFDSATADTVAGTYNVTVSSLGTAAASSVLFSGGATSDTTIGVRSGTLVGLYAVRNGDTAASIAAGLNEALEASGITARASESGGGVVISSESPGASSSFEFTSDYGTTAFSTFTGTNPTGTIDGVAATGSGRYLSLPTDSTSNAKGLKLSLGSSTDASGSISYYGGTAGIVAALATRLLTSGNGTLAISSTSRESRISAFDKQITRLEARMTLREGALRRQYSQLDSIMGGLKGQQSWMTNQISSLNKS
jgi:flagellar hook-associated protein 2